MRPLAAAVVSLALATAAHAEDDERYLMNDYGIRVDLPEDWSGLSWSDWALEAESEDRTLKIFVWGGGVQTPIVTADAKAWAQVIVDKAESIGAKDIVVEAADVADIAGRPTARTSLTFAFGKDLEGAFEGATFAVEGKMVHVAVLTAKRRADKAADALSGVLARSEVRRPPAATAYGAQVTGAGTTVKLPSGWRVPLERELSTVAKRAELLGIEDLTDCWTGLRPRAATDPDLLVTCGAGLNLGVVDAYSASDVDATLRERIFGGVEVGEADILDNQDGRVTFLYAPNLGAHSLRVGIAPYGAGIARTWALGAAGADAILDGAVRKVLLEADYGEPHPAGAAEWVTYYVTYRPTSAPVLGAAALLVLVVGGGIMGLRGGRKDPYALDDDEV